MQKTEARKGKTWNNHIIKPPKQLFLSICCLEQKQEVGRKVEKRARSQARRRGGKSFQMKIQLFVSFFSCTQQQNIHKFLLLYRSIILLLFYFILCPSWTARGKNHLAMCCIIPAHARLIKVDSTQSVQCSGFIGIIHICATCGTSYYAATTPGQIHFTGDWRVKYIFHNFSCDNRKCSSVLLCSRHKLLNLLRRKANTLPF